VARANAAAGTLSIVPEAGTHSLENVAAAGPAAARIAQLHPLGKEDNFPAHAERIEAAGYSRSASPWTARPEGGASATSATPSSSAAGWITGNYPPGNGVPVEEVFGQLFDCDEPVWPWSRLGRSWSPPACRIAQGHPHRGRPGGR